MSIQTNPALYGSIMFHGAKMLPELRRLPFAILKKIGEEASVFSCENPLWLQPYASEKQFVVPSYSCDKLSGCQVVALMVFTLWVSCGEEEAMCSSLCEVWPIKEAVLLARGNRS